MADRSHVLSPVLSGNAQVIGSFKAGRIILLAAVLAMGVFTPAMAGPSCTITYSCPQKIYTPPNYLISCNPPGAQFSEVSPAGTWTYLGGGLIWSGTTVLYNVLIEACLGLGPPSQTCTGFSIGVSQAGFCAPPPPPPPPLGRGAKACLLAGGNWTCGDVLPGGRGAKCSCSF